MAARDDTFITFDEATKMLQTELKYPAEKAQKYVDRFDKNKDGKLSMCEFKAFCKTVEETKANLVPKFREYDEDGNGYITLREACKILEKAPFSFPPGKVLFLLRRFDTDGNGKLDIEEFADFFSEAKAVNIKIQSQFDQLDKDGNGILSVDEIKVVLKNCMDLDDEGAKHLVQMFDENKDGQLNKTEFMNMWGNMF